MIFVIRAHITNLLLVHLGKIGCEACGGIKHKKPEAPYMFSYRHFICLLAQHLSTFHGGLRMGM